MEKESYKLSKHNSNLEQRVLQLEQQLKQGRIQIEQDDELLQFERLLSELSSRFINLSAKDTKAEIEKGLKTIAHFLDVDQIAIIEFLKDRKRLEIVYSYSRDEIHSVLPEFPSDSFPWWTEQVRKGNLIVWRNLPGDAPEGAEAEKLYAIADGIRAHLAIPLSVGNTVMGAVACHSFSKT